MTNSSSARALASEAAAGGPERASLRLLRPSINVSAGNPELPGLFRAITTVLRSIVPFEFSQLYLYDPDIKQLRTRALYFPKGRGLACEGMTVPIDGTPAGWAFTRGQPLRMERPDAVRTPNDIVDRLLEEGVRSGCCVPLAYHDHVLGVFSVGHSREAAFTQEDEQVLCEVADQFAVAIERALVRRLCNGETALFPQLVQPYERTIYRLAYSVVRNSADAEDVAQETLLKALARLQQLRSPEGFGPWLLQIAINEARMRKRKYRRRPHVSLDATPDWAGGCGSLAGRWPDWRPIPSEVLEQKELKRALAGALASLPEIYREVCILNEIDGLPFATTAALLGISVPAAKTRAHRARLQLRFKLQALEP